MRFRDRAAAIVLLCVTLAASGCISGESRDIPPAPTAAPGGSAIFVYVAQANDPDLGVNGGAVSVYRLGADGFLPGGPPAASVSAVNPRRLVRHPELPVLYVATSSQVLAFDISGGGLVSLCGPGGGLGAPCATEARPGGNAVDMTFLRNEAGQYLLYVVEQGGGQNLDTTTRLAAYELGSNGELPSLPSSQAQTLDAIAYQGAAVTPQFAYVGDVGQSDIIRFPLQADGNLPDPVPTATPLVPTATPPPTPTVAPTQTPLPSPSPTAYKAFGPGKMIQAVGQAAPGEVQTVLYVVQQSRRRISAAAIDAAGDLPKDPTSESNTRGLYNSIIVDSFSAPQRIFGAAFQNGQVDTFAIQADGNIVDNTLSTTFANTSSYPTGLALLDFTPAGGVPSRTLFVSLGGFNRVDAYTVNPDGTIADRPYSSTEPQNDTFPADVLVYVVP
jgi:6-phosphogluconolactonase (cycloisomerase 2 family)